MEYVFVYLDFYVCEVIENYEISNVLSVKKWNVIFGIDMMYRGCYGFVVFFFGNI